MSNIKEDRSEFEFLYVMSLIREASSSEEFQCRCKIKHGILSVAVIDKSTQETLIYTSGDINVYLQMERISNAIEKYLIKK